MFGLVENKRIATPPSRPYCSVCDADAASCIRRLKDSSSKEVKSDQKTMEESFVHLPSNSPEYYPPKSRIKTGDGQMSHHLWDGGNHRNTQIVQTGLLESCNQMINVVNLCSHYLTMEQEQEADGEGSDSGEGHINEQLQLPVLCASCISRTIHAIESNIQQLHYETQIYRAALPNQKHAQYNTSESTMNQNASSSVSTLSYYQNECEMLSAALRVHEQEFILLQKRGDDIRNLNRTLSQQEEQLQRESRALEFTSTHQMKSGQLPKMTNYLQRAQEEYDAVSSIKVPWLMFDIQPQQSMINYLRLAHQPNAKYNIEWNEINAAWSQAAQLLYMVGAAINFTSPNTKIVPLSSCAKIIEVVGTKTRQIIHTLGNESTMSTETDTHQEEAKLITIDDDKKLNNLNNREFLLSICAYHRLFYQLVHYIICEHDELMTITAQKYYYSTDITTSTEEIQGSSSDRSLPFEMELDSIGGLNLSLNASNQDWSDIIFRVVSNLKWVSSLITLWSSYSN